ncbi:Hsp70 family protein [Streptomyces sp. NPDC001288]|uniref:Hsp70 family protein n=1 Tax=unclassified Streptomyces TaxID=2593676 RepID=UPI00332A3796
MIAAIDFGASATKAALFERGVARPVLIDGAPESSSAVFLHRNGRLLSGVGALASAQRRPHRMQAALKRRINRPDEIEPVHQEVEFDTVVLRPLVRCAAAVIGHAWQAVLQETGGVEVPLLLTHPVGWSEFQRAAVLEAATLAGVRPAGLVSEAEAVGWHIRAARPATGPLLVADVGASTLDIAVLDLEPSERITVRYADGDNYLGGDDFDREVLALVAAALSDDPRDAALLTEFTEFCDELPHLAAREAERVKRMAAETGAAVFARGDIAVDVAGDEFFDATAHLVDRIAGRVRRAIEGGTVRPRTMVVSGGAARLSSIHDALAELADEAGIEYLTWDGSDLPGTATAAVSLGAAGMPRPWGGNDARARRPVTLEHDVLTAGGGASRAVAIPGGLVVGTPMPGVREQSADAPSELVRLGTRRPREDRLLLRPHGVAAMGYDPFGDRLVTVARDRSACVWYLGEDRPLRSCRPYWQSGSAGLSGVVVAAAAHGDLVAWADSDGVLSLVGSRRRHLRLGHPAHRLAFTARPYLLALGADRITLVDPGTAEILDVLQLPGPAPFPVVALAGEASLVFTASDRDIQCYDCSSERFTPVWKREAFVASALAVVRVESLPVLVTYDTKVRLYRALDARTGVQNALKDAEHASVPVELLADGRSGVAYARHERGELSVLTFAGALR